MHIQRQGLDAAPLVSAMLELSRGNPREIILGSDAAGQGARLATRGEAVQGGTTAPASSELLERQSHAGREARIQTIR